MKLHHIAIWTFRLEELKEFYIRFFGGRSNEKYINLKKGFESYFIYFAEGPSLELMSRIDVQKTPIEENKLGLTHLAFNFPNREEILRITELLRSEGYTIAGEPRTSGDGYFESVILDPDGNRIECVYKNEKEDKEANAIDKTPNLKTDRLLLRPFQDEDAEALYICCKNPNIGNNAGWAPHRNLEESRTILRNVFIGQENIWAITLKDTQQLIGSVGIIADPKRENPQVRMLGYWLDEAQWGKGYMTEAVQAVISYGFNELCLCLITANCYPHNKRSQQVLTRNGFIYEGVLHQAELTYNGNILDHECYYLPNISRPMPHEYDELVQLWEEAVRNTHHFLTEENIQFYKPLIKKHYLPAVELYIIRNAKGKIAAFMGLSDEQIEMLFVHPDEQRKGYGKRLVEYAVHRKQMDKVDVNEDNEKALLFYLSLGFQIVGRDDTDSIGKPFPILHLEMPKANQK